MNQLKKIGVVLTVFLTVFSVTPITYAANNDPVTVNVGVNATISIGCTATVTMGAIGGTGQSALTTNTSTCNIKTNNSTGYKLEWVSGDLHMHQSANAIDPYTPAVANTPETWSLTDNTTSEWGGHLDSTSTTPDTGVWGAADTYAGGKWLNVAVSAKQLMSRSTETTSSGDNEKIIFGAEIGSLKSQPTGAYTVTVTMTATTI